ncbi:hypothetical protein [Bifidobacterium olomucense]|uniref:Uncharacterized protein n=1 Tax=Bifidobacterium olomucense TaxID=2675324 RepID=A0A7Y0EXE7_9BIFI|nr:hypothetical protein [Bifidobacterium sp. DSM 109959]NMM98139.1 hypothetical protein [Bifidobacterium sp. DSM 109959]
MENFNENYDYFEAVQSDILDWLDDNHEDYSDVDSARDDCELAVTGNDNGSYTCNSYLAAEYVRPFIFGDEWCDFTDFVINDLGADMAKVMEDAETLDVYVRTWVFGQVWSDLLDDKDWDDLDVVALRKAVA